VSLAPAGAAFISIVWWWLPALALGAQPRPDPALSPDEVIRTVVEALQNCNSPSPNAGIFTVYQFASAANRAHTGPYGNFLRLLKLRGFVPLLSGHADSYGPLAISGNRAEQRVRFRIAGGRVAWFRFAVSRQTSQQTRGRCTGCWMVDGVAPMPAEPSD
jgi:hypothetical protein